MHLDGWFGGSEVGTSVPAVLSLVGMAMFMFVGCEFVTPLAPEMKAPGKTIPRAMALGLVGVAICMFLYGAAIRRWVANVPVSADGLTHLLDTPGAIPAFALQVLGRSAASGSASRSCAPAPRRSTR